MKFDVSEYSDGATINSVEFSWICGATNYPYWSITPVSVIRLQLLLLAFMHSIQMQKELQLLLKEMKPVPIPPAGENLYTWRKCKCKPRCSSCSKLVRYWHHGRGYSILLYCFSWLERGQQTYLVIDYTYVPPYTWLKVNGSNSTSGTVTGGNNQNP